MNQATDTPLSLHELEEVLRRILGQEHALPEDWEPQATTYDLPRFHSEAEFLTRFEAAARQMLAQEIHDSPRLRALLADCGHPYDYARLGHPLSTVYELYLRHLTGAGHVVTFASRTKAFLAPIEARQMPHSPVRLYAGEPVPRSSVCSGPRVGVTTAKTLPWRFWLDGSPAVSPYREAVARPRRLTDSAVARAFCVLPPARLLIGRG